MARVMLRDEAEVARLGSELTEHAHEWGLPYWQALGHFLQGWHARQSGPPADAIGRLELGLELWGQRGSRVFRPVCLAFLADAYAADRKSGLARSTFDEALQTAADTGERWAEPEIHRLYGDFLAHDKDSPPPAAIAHYERAIEIAQQQGSRSLELRATMSLARLALEQGSPIQWHERLSKIYQTFSEGWETEDLREAGALLGALPRA
jgi:predicted ATPase